MDKENVIHLISWNVIQLLKVGTYNIIDELWGHKDEQIKPVTQGEVPHDSLSLVVKTLQKIVLKVEYQLC